MVNELSEEIKEVRKVVMTRNTYDRVYEKALQKYDELAIRLDQMRRLLALFEDDNETLD